MCDEGWREKEAALSANCMDKERRELRATSEFNSIRPAQFPPLNLQKKRKSNFKNTHVIEKWN